MDLKESVSLIERMDGLKSYYRDKFVPKDEKVEHLDEISINKKKQNMNTAVNAIDGVQDYVKTFCIITGQSQMGQKGTNNINRNGNNNILQVLRDGKYAYVPVKGKYGRVEDTFMIFNIPIDNAKYLAKETRQQSFIFGRKENCKTFFDYYEYDENSREYRFIETKDYYQDMTNSTDYYTEIGNKKKFSIPFDVFNECCSTFNSIISEQMNKSQKYRENYEERVKKCLMENRTGRFLYENRCLVYGSLFSSKF